MWELSWVLGSQLCPFHSSAWRDGKGWEPGFCSAHLSHSRVPRHTWDIDRWCPGSSYKPSSAQRAQTWLISHLHQEMSPNPSILCSTLPQALQAPTINCTHCFQRHLQSPQSHPEIKQQETKAKLKIHCRFLLCVKAGVKGQGRLLQ